MHDFFYIELKIKNILKNINLLINFLILKKIKSQLEFDILFFFF